MVGVPLPYHQIFVWEISGNPTLLKRDMVKAASGDSYRWNYTSNLEKTFDLLMRKPQQNKQVFCLDLPSSGFSTGQISQKQTHLQQIR